MAADRSTDFGSKLRAARERRGASLRQIAAATKISVSALDALERNDVARLPGGIFSRAFVRSYATEIGLDPDEAIQEFLAQFPHDAAAAAHTQAQQVVENEAIESERRTASTFLKLIAISVPIAGVVLYFSTAGRRKPVPRPTTEAAQPTAAQESQGARTFGERLPAVAPAASDRGEHLAVEIVADRACSVTAVVDGAPQSRRRLAAGDRQRFDAARELMLTVDNPAAVSLSVNGQPARRFGDSTQPATLRLTTANYKDDVTLR